MERNRSALILLELMAAILIFALAGAVCLSILVRADDLSGQAADLRRGVRHVSSAAEVIRSSPSTEDALQALEKAWPQGDFSGPATISLEDGTLVITWEDQPALTIYNIVYTREGETLYSLELARSWQEVSP